MQEYFNVFISFRTDGGSVLAEKIANAVNCECLLGEGKRAFCSKFEGTINIGRLFPDALKQAVEECELFVSVLSAGALDEVDREIDYVKEEIKTALEARRPMFVIRFRGFVENPGWASVNYLKQLMNTQSAVNDYSDCDEAFEHLKNKLKRHYHQLISDKSSRREYDRVLSQKGFLDWMTQVCQTIYADDVAARDDIEFIRLFDFEYDGVIHTCPEARSYAEFPFSGLCRTPYDLSKFDDAGNRINIHHVIEASREERKKLRRDYLQEDSAQKYLRIVSDTIFYPERVGFMMQRIDFQRDAGAVTAYYDIYFNNLRSSHFLDYELFELYTRRAERGDLTVASKDELMSHMPARQRIHAACRALGGPIIVGAGRCSNYGIQVMVVLRNPKGELCTYLMERSLTVAAKPGFLQIIPSGGFEAYGDDLNDTYIESNFDVLLAIYRELLEECFGLKERAFENTPYGVYNDPRIKGLHSLLRDGKARFVFLGSAMGLGALRPELSFLLYIEDDSFSQGLIPNFESRHSIQLVPIRDIVSERFWTRPHFNQYSKEDCPKGTMLNTTTAGLIALAQKHSLFGDLLRNA
jgi:hypothetical protein